MLEMWSSGNVSACHTIFREAEGEYMYYKPAFRIAIPSELNTLFIV